MRRAHLRHHKKHPPARPYLLPSPARIRRTGDRQGRRHKGGSRSECRTPGVNIRHTANSTQTHAASNRRTPAYRLVRPISREGNVLLHHLPVFAPLPPLDMPHVSIRPANIPHAISVWVGFPTFRRLPGVPCANLDSGRMVGAERFCRINAGRTEHVSAWGFAENAIRGGATRRRRGWRS